MVTGTSTVRRSYRDVRGLYLGVDFMREAALQPGQTYPILIDGLDNLDVEGTLDKSSFIAGLAPLYSSFELEDGDEIEVRWDGSALHFSVPKAPRSTLAAPRAAAVQSVFDRQKLRHLHIELFAPGNLARWNPQTEPDIYLALGVLSEYTDFRYCCGASKALLDRLGYQSDTKPDAILMDRTSGAYLLAEFKMRSSEFVFNHKAEDVDVLVCWVDDAADKSQLPPCVLALQLLLERAVHDGKIDL